MLYFSKINNNFFFKGFFHWFGIEEYPMAKRICTSAPTQPHLLIKKDLQNVKKAIENPSTRSKKNA